MGLADADVDTVESAVELVPADVGARRLRMAGIATLVVILDQLTKWWAVEVLDGEIVSGPLGSRLRLVFNTGSAFSLGPDFGPVFGVLALVVAIALFWVIKRVDRSPVVLGLGLVQGGAVGNVIDRLFRDGDGFLGGAVIDFLEVGDWWPVFNFADVAIVIGGLMVVVFGSRA